MLSLFECRERAGLGSHEVVLGATLGQRHEALLASYLLNLSRGERFVLEMIVADLRGFVDLGALDLAGDVFVVLRLFLDGRPHLSQLRYKQQQNGDGSMGCRLRMRASQPIMREIIAVDGRATI